jgi:hypothetical protein
MAFSDKPGGPQVGAARVMALVVPAPDADIAILPHARLSTFHVRVATAAIADPVIAGAIMRAGGMAAVRVHGCGGMQRNRGRFSA